MEALFMVCLYALIFVTHAYCLLVERIYAIVKQGDNIGARIVSMTGGFVIESFAISLFWPIVMPLDIIIDIYKKAFGIKDLLLSSLYVLFIYMSCVLA